MLKLQNIKKSFGNKIIFNDANYEFEPGIYFLIGQNGAGKSTLLKIIAGIDSNYEGTVLGHNIFYLPEKLTLPKELMTYELINQYSKINKSMGSFLELAMNYRLENMPIKKLSKGMIQKVGIIISLLDKYDVICKVVGGGFTGQAGAIRLGITRALMLVNPDYRASLKPAGMCTRDPRQKERKKYGLKKARRAPQFSKR